MSTIIPLIMVMIIGGILGLMKNGIVMIIPFLVIRKFSGGFHAKREWVWGISSVCSVHCCWDYIDCCFAGACLGAEKISGRKLGDYRKVIAFFDVM